MKILITGSRTWIDRTKIQKLMMQYRNAFFIFGDCPTGADAIAWAIAKRFKIKYKRFVAHWRIYGSSAGPIRNQEMVDYGPELAFAFRMPGKSKGTDDCINRCRAGGIESEIIKHGGLLGETM